MPDPLNPIESFAARGLAWASQFTGRSVTIGGVLYRGTRTELTVEPAEVQHGGKKIPRAFSILIPRGDAAPKWHLPDPKHGTDVTDDLGRKFTINEIKSDAVQIILTCVGLWG